MTPCIRLHYGNRNIDKDQEVNQQEHLVITSDTIREVEKKRYG